jgi:hypothetical protein
MELFLTIILGIFLFFWVLSKILPFLLTRWVKKKFGAFGAGNNFNYEQERGREGDVHIDHVGKQEKVVDKNVGEYVDFEEEKNK